jgi:hypothetical protein
MNETGFSENFVWYEWGFISPDEFPREAFGVKVERDPIKPESRDQRTRSFDFWDADS